MFSSLTKSARNLSLYDIGQYCFYLGTIFLSSTNLLSGFFYLISLFISFKIKPLSLYKDKWNLVLLVSTILIVLSSLINFYFQNYDQFYKVAKGLNWNPSSIWLSLFNWIPFFLIFTGFQIYLRGEKQRLKFAKFIYIGLIPVLISFFLQKWFKVYGPFEYLNGLVVFYLKPMQSIGYAGLFSNPNYAGLWLSASLPFSILLFRFNRKKNLKRAFIFITILSTIYCIISTNSRNSFIGIFIAALLMTNVKLIIFSIIVIFLFYFFIINSINIPLINELIPEKILNKLIQTNYLSKFQSPRLDIWSKSFNFIKQKPLFGWGAATFPILYFLEDGITKDSLFWNARHTHSMPLEIAQIYGLPISIILTFFVGFLFLKSWRIIFRFEKNFNSLINKAWISSTLIILVSHLTDITYYDGRISLLIWILLCGLKCILDEDKIKPSEQVNNIQS